MSVVGLPELLLVLPFAAALCTIFYLLSLRKALSVCAPENRTLSPALVWLLLLPIFNLLWHFFVVMAVSRSFRNELQKRGLEDTSRSLKVLGLATCVLTVLSFVPMVVLVAGFSALVCWICFWAKVAKTSRLITLTPEHPLPPESITE